MDKFGEALEKLEKVLDSIDIKKQKEIYSAISDLVVSLSNNKITTRSVNLQPTIIQEKANIVVVRLLKLKIDELSKPNKK